MTTKNDYAYTTLNSEASVLSLVAKQQAAFFKARGSSALAQMVGEGYVTIQRILKNASAMDQAAILDQHGVAPATGTTSKFTPWIKVIWGEQHRDPNEKFVDATGVERRVWVPDRSMEVYFHTMEELERLGVNANHADVIVEHKGALKMADARKARLREDAKPSREATEQVQRNFYLAEKSAAPLDLPIALPEGVGEFFTVLCRRADDERCLAIGVVDANATSTLNRVAKAEYDALLKAKADREEAAKREAETERRIAAAVEADRQRFVGGLNSEERNALYRRVMRKQRATPSENADKAANG